MAEPDWHVRQGMVMCWCRDEENALGEENTAHERRSAGGEMAAAEGTHT